MEGRGIETANPLSNGYRCAVPPGLPSWFGVWRSWLARRSGGPEGGGSSPPTPTEPDVDALMDIIERIMTQHWDLAACWCWVCQSGREAGCRPRAVFLHPSWPSVRVDMVEAL